MSLDLGPTIRSAILDQQVPELRPIAEMIVDVLGNWSGEPCIFAYRPTPADAPDPMIVINPPAAISDADGLTSSRPIVTGDVAIYGKKGPPGDLSDQSADVERAGYLIRELFHRQRFSMSPDGYSVISIIASGPVPAPVDDDATVGRVVSLTISLRRNA